MSSGCALHFLYIKPLRQNVYKSIVSFLKKSELGPHISGWPNCRDSGGSLGAWRRVLICTLEAKVLLLNKALGCVGGNVIENDQCLNYPHEKITCLHFEH